VRHALILLAACGNAPPPPPAAPPPPQLAVDGCRDAALGLEHATTLLRPAEASIVTAMLRRCHADAWPAPAVACFAKMTLDDLGRCARELTEPAREAMFGVLGLGEPDRTAIAIARAKLADLAVGIAACDQFVSAVARVLTCERMPLDMRVQLGNETADFWSLPTHDLPTDARDRMAAVCGTSLQALEQHAAAIGCLP
jgi:hypothetical protein